MKLKITVHGVAYEVEVEVLDAGDGFAAPSALPPVAPRPGTSPTPPPSSSAPATPKPAAPAPAESGDSKGTVNSPIAGTVVEVRCAVGDQVDKDQVLIVVDAMKMHTSIASPLAGKVSEVKVGVGDAVRENQPLVEIA